MSNPRNRDRRGARAPSQRQLRVGEMLRHALCSILERDELRDPELAGAPVTVTEVRASPDLRNATVFVVPLGGEGGPEVVSALRRAAPFLRRRLGDSVDLRYVPALQFEADSSFDHAQRIEELLREAPVAADDDESGHGA